MRRCTFWSCGLLLWFTREVRDSISPEQTLRKWHTKRYHCWGSTAGKERLNGLRVPVKPPLPSKAAGVDDHKRRGQQQRAEHGKHDPNPCRAASALSNVPSPWITLLHANARCTAAAGELSGCIWAAKILAIAVEIVSHGGHKVFVHTVHFLQSSTEILPLGHKGAAADQDKGN